MLKISNINHHLNLIEIWTGSIGPVTRPASSNFSGDLSILIRPKQTVKKLIISLAILTAAIGIASPVQAQVGQNNVGASINFGNGETALGLDARFGISDNLSIRPNLYFPASATIFGAAVTYDFPSVDTERRLTPFVGLGGRFNSGGNNTSTIYATAGADYSLDSNFILKGNLSVPFSNNGATTTVGIGAGISF